jgi:carbon-monoxide dehydrogenase large subunit
MDTTIVGKSIANVDGPCKVTGKALFTADMYPQDALIGTVLRSRYPHARILHVDTAKARRLPGIKAVVTGQDFPMTYNVAIKDQPFLAIDRVRYVGEPVAAVAATDGEIAEEALSLITVEYDELPAVFDPVESMKADAIRIHPDMASYIHDPNFEPLNGTNICNHFKLRRGDIEAGFAKADLIVENTFRSQVVQHLPLEPHATIAQWDAAGKLTVWTTAQSPHFDLYELARSLSLPESKVRIIVPYVGGAFGCKHGLKSEPVAVALAYFAKNRAVKVVLSREEVFTSTVVRGATQVTLKSGVMKDGSIIARQSTVIWDTGAYADVGPLLCRNASYSSTGPYAIPNQWIDGYCVYTNKNVAGAFRGYGLSEMGWAFESHTDTIAAEMKMDPVELRLKNLLDEGSISATGQVLHSVGIKECLRRAAAAIDWGTPAGPWRGKGVACTYKASHAPSSSSAFVKLNDDGSVSVLTSTVDMGQGSNTILAQVAAEALGAPLDSIVVSQADTDFTPPDRSTSSSRATFHMGNAVRIAAEDVRKQLLDIAADRLEVSLNDLVGRDGKIWVTGMPDKSLLFRDLVKIVPGRKGGPVLGRGAYFPEDATALDLETGQGGRSAAFWMYGAHAAEIEVDPETGEVRVHKIVAAHDVGKAINPLNVEGQIEGGVVMGLGVSLMEELVIEDGRTLNPNLTDYKVPTIFDVPSIVPIIVEVPQADGPYGAKGIGEASTTPVAPAIGNALFQATGVRMTELPLTPERVFWALKRGKPV